MNIFEELVEELKDDNLLEATVTENRRDENEAELAASGFVKNQAADFNSAGDAPPELAGNDEVPNDGEDTSTNEETAENALSEEDFYRRRAVEEIAGLQMVDHVITGVEREQMKLVPQPFDDLAVKKTLHSFIQNSKEAGSPEYAAAEAALVRESETWCSALAHRDRRVSVADLRRYCETTKPVLSSQALISLARFYRNLPFSESVRNKFDLVVTKLFSKEIGGEKRYMVFGCAELAGHLTELYAEWSSINFYPENEKESEIKEFIRQFGDFAGESEKAGNFDELIAGGFFIRVKQFKETTQELFFEPRVTAAAVECNIRIGNRYVDLIEQERNHSETDDFQDKYGFLHDQTISDAASKTLQLVELLKEKKEEAVEDETPHRQVQTKPAVKQPPKEFELFTQTFLDFSQVNRTLVIITICVMLVCGGLYAWANFYADEGKISVNVKKVDLENSPYKSLIKTARVTNQTYYAIMMPDWNKQLKDKKETVLKSLFNEGKNGGYEKVVMLDETGGIVAYAEGAEIKISE